MSKVKIRLKPHEAIALGFEVRQTNGFGNTKYYVSETQVVALNKIRDFQSTEFKEVKRTLDKDGEVISKVEKLTSKGLIEIPENHQIKRVSTNVSTQQQWVISEPLKGVEKAIKEIDFLNIFKDFKPFEYTPQPLQNIALFDRLVLTDIHIGMEVNKDGYSLYDGLWDEKTLFERLKLVIDWVLVNRKSSKLIIHELGDYLDGYDAVTTRGGHSLPQNMDNQMMFDVGLKFKIALIDSLIPFYETIEMVNICNDNHAGSFGYIVNSAFKTYIELKYPNNVKVINQRKFIDHYFVDNRCFILTHGKDDKSLKFGFKPKLDPVQIEKIKNYIDEYKLYSYFCEFSKGDSHQLLTDSTTSTAFEYQNFGAFSPPSDWVKINFKNTLSCFTFFNYYEKQKTINNFIFDKQ